MIAGIRNSVSSVSFEWNDHCALLALELATTNEYLVIVLYKGCKHLRLAESFISTQPSIYSIYNYTYIYNT